MSKIFKNQIFCGIIFGWEKCACLKNWRGRPPSPPVPTPLGGNEREKAGDGGGERRGAVEGRYHLMPITAWCSYMLSCNIKTEIESFSRYSLHSFSFKLWLKNEGF